MNTFHLVISFQYVYNFGENIKRYEIRGPKMSDHINMCGYEIKRIRSDLGFTQSDFANELGAGSAAVISNYENGRRSPDRAFIKRVMSLAHSNCLMIDVNKLLS